MKKSAFQFLSLLIITLTFLANILTSLAQSPQKMSYQAVVRNNSEQLVTNQMVGMRISILQGSDSGTAVYTETQTPTTNANGLVTFEIGTGTTSDNFSAIDWANGPYYIKTSTDLTGGNSYTISGVSQLLSVPYALHAKSVENGLILPYKDSALAPDLTPVFEIISKEGNSYTEAIRGVADFVNGTGVKGVGTFGVIGVTYAPGGTGTSGVSMKNTGSGFGLSGVSNSSDGGGVWGNGGLYGVDANANSTKGYGLYATASSTTGTTYGVYGKVYSGDGYSGYFKGGKFYISGRTGIGTETPSAGLHLKGTGFPESFIYLEAASGNDAGFRLYEGTTAKWHIYNVSGAGGLHICNSAFTTAIFAKQSNSYVGINTTTPNYNLDVNGTAGKTGGGSWSTSSDIRLKNVTGNYNKGLSEITALQPVLFTYKIANPRNLPSDAEQIGFVAQDVQKVFPEAVTEAEDGYLDFNIHAINVAVVNALKELKTENDQLKAENEILKSKNELIESRLTNLEKIIGVSAMQ
jgi:hypothetical protein